MTVITYDELERLKEEIENGSLLDKEKYCEYWDFEDEYSHNEIDEAVGEFLVLANDYFKKNNLNYKASYNCESVLVKKVRLK